MIILYINAFVSVANGSKMLSTQPRTHVFLHGEETVLLYSLYCMLCTCSLVSRLMQASESWAEPGDEANVHVW